MLVAVAVGVALVIDQAACQTTSLDLKNGDRVSGFLVSESTNQLVLSNAWSSALTLPIAQIVRRTTNLSAGMVFQVGMTNQPPAEAASNNAACTISGTALSAPLPPLTKKLAGEVEIGLDLLKGAKDRQLYHGRGKITYINQRLRDTVDVMGSYGQTQGVVDSDRLDAANKTDFDLVTRWYAYNLLGAGYDHVRKIDLRYDVGPGVGWRMLKQPTLAFNVEAGFDYQTEDRNGSPDTSRFFARLSQSGSWKINHKFSLDHRFDYLPSLEDPTEFRLRGEANLRYWLLQHLSLNLTLLDIYDTSPAKDVTPNDLQFRSSIGVKF